jgi:hypothetical protein
MMDHYYGAVLRDCEAMPTNASVSIREFSRNLIYVIDVYIIYVHLLDGSLMSLVLRSLTQISLSLPQDAQFLRTLSLRLQPSRHNETNVEVSPPSVLFKKNIYTVLVMNGVFVLRHLWITPGASLFMDMLGTGKRDSLGYLLCLDVVFMSLQWIYIHLPYYKSVDPSSGLSVESDISAEERV